VLSSARTLATLARSVLRPTSRSIAARALLERLRRLLERLAWVDAVLASTQKAASRADLTATLRKMLPEFGVRFACRWLAIQEQFAGSLLARATEDQAELAIRCLLSFLLNLQTGTIRMVVSPEGALFFEHPDIQPERESLSLSAARMVFDRLDVSLRVEPARLVLVPRN